MPSGAKKRKAAKKKKENKSNNSNLIRSSASTHSHGKEDVKHQDNQESDGGEVSSPGSQDNHNHQSFSTEGEEEEIETERNLLSLSAMDGSRIKVVEMNIVVEESVLPVEKEIEIDDVDRKDGSEDVKHQDSKESDSGEVSSPGSQDNHNHQSVSTEGEEEEIEMGRNLLNLSAVDGSRIKVVEMNIVVEESALQVGKKIKTDDVDRKDGSLENDGKSYGGGLAGSSSSSSSSSDNESRGIKNSRAVVAIDSVVYPVKVADSLSRSSAKTIHHASVGETDDSGAENISAADSGKIPSLGENVEVDMSSPADISVSLYAVESILKENGEIKLSSIEALEKEEEPIVQSVEKTATNLDPKECATLEKNCRLILPHNAPRATADNEAEKEKDSGVTKTLLVPFPCPVQKTSWKNCCGLFEVFSGSGL